MLFEVEPTLGVGYDPLKELNVQLFEIQSVVGKGKGLVARFNIAKGARIFYER